MKNNWFNTLGEALDAEGLYGTYPPYDPPINYNEHHAYTYDDGTKHGHYVSLYRNEKGLYERPVHYSRN